MRVWYVLETKHILKRGWKNKNARSNFFKFLEATKRLALVRTMSGSSAVDDKQVRVFVGVRVFSLVIVNIVSPFL